MNAVYQTREPFEHKESHAERQSRKSKKLLKIPFLRLGYHEIDLDYRGHTCDPAIKTDLESGPKNFLDGYHIALESATVAELTERLEAEIDPAFQGFAFEGAGMYLAILDFVTPRFGQRGIGRRANEFMTVGGRSHDYIICIGIGFAIARIPWAKRKPVQYAMHYPPGYSGLVLDGYGFHEGFFHSERVIERCQRPGGLDGYAGCCFDAGLGRSLWFVKGASPERLRDAIAQFPAERQPDLWAGLGLACTYAGSAYQDLAEYRVVLQQLQEYAGPYRKQLQLGVVFAAETRRKGNNPTVWTETACAELLNMSFADAAQLGIETWEGTQQDLAGRPNEEVSLLMHQLVNERVIAQLR